MTTPSCLNETIDRIADGITDAYLKGIVDGLRRMTVKADTPMSMLYEAIREMDKEFGVRCPHPSWKDDRCERCGATDPFATEKP